MANMGIYFTSRHYIIDHLGAYLRADSVHGPVDTVEAEKEKRKHHSGHHVDFLCPIGFIVQSNGPRA